MLNFNLKSLGCKQNTLEGQIIIDNLVQNGFVYCDDIKKCNFYILNSCTVTSSADSSANYFIKKAKKDNPKIKTILVGCLAQTYKEHKNFNYKIADYIFGNKEKMELYKHLKEINTKNFKVGNIFEEKEFQNCFLYNPTTTRVSVKIQDGCNNRCSYCIIPYARGNSRSNSIENIIKQIQILSEKGIKEIVLTGIHIGLWGKEWNKSLIDLLKEIEKTNIYRYRLGSLYVNEIDDNLIEFLKKSKKFCPHFHLSLQSMSDNILKAMNRNYSVDSALYTIQKLKSSFNLPFLGCDIIVGFPNESEEDFKKTYDNLSKAKLSYIHAFPYSKRENTIAYSMKNQIKDSIKKQRMEKLIDLSNKLHNEFLEQNKNQKAEILVQKKSQKTGEYSAVTRNYIKIYFKSENDNLRHTIKIVELKNYKLH